MVVVNLHFVRNIKSYDSAVLIGFNRLCDWLALKDAISNLLSGVLTLLYRPFKIGNRIKISGYEGIVISIDLRYTQLDSEVGKVLIPNSKLFIDPVTVVQ